MVHWAIAGPFLVCFASALILFFIYNPDRSRPYRSLFAWLHRTSGVALIVFPMLASFKCRGDMRIHWYNVKQVWTWMWDDVKWLFLLLVAAVWSGVKLPEQGKFNAAEKINFMVLLVTYPLYVATGLLLWITRVAPLSWLLHVSMAIFAAPFLLGHLYMAMISRSGRIGLPGIITGFVDRQWAKHHYRRWYREFHEPAEQQPEIETDDRSWTATVLRSRSMARFTWSAEHEVFLAPVDAEHRDLFRIADELHAAVTNGAPPDAVSEHLHHLAAYMAEHFSHEEELMRRVCYPSLRWHTKQHDSARQRLKLLAPLVEAGDRQAARLLFHFLARWLHDHTTLTDRIMASFVRNHERTHPAATSVDRGYWTLALPAN
jgi:formate dehydrogenase gamma subunit